MKQIGYQQTTSQSFESVQDRVRSAIRTEGLSIVSEINAQATFLQKLGVMFQPYLILGVCHPQTAHAVVSADPEMGHFLPCNVLVYQQGDVVHVSAVQPSVMMSLTHQPDIEQYAKEIEEKLHRIVDASII